jgi:subtilisin
VRHRLPALAALSLAAASFVVMPTTNALGTTPYIVVVEEGVSPASHGRAHGLALDHVYGRVLPGYATRLSPRQVEELRADDRVDLVTPDRAVRGVAQTVPTGVNRANADSASTLAGSGSGSVNADVAVLDTGIDLDHPDLTVHASGARNCSSGSSADDGNGHGTHVAGTIGARDNATGVVGVAPGARLWPVRVLDNQGSGTWSSIICGLDHVARNADRVEVANLSLSGGGTDDRNCGKSNNDALHRAICNVVGKGVTVVAAAGNAATNTARSVPAAYDEVITVSALADFNGRPGGGAAATCRSDVDDTFASFSNYGSDVDLIAPGVCIRSTWRGGAYNTISGTSMAAPHVAGGAALYRSTHPSATPAGVRSALQSAGTYDWNSADDPDGIKEKLLNVSGF